MAGDTLRDAFRSELDAVIAAASPSITWTRRDSLNTATAPDASTGYFEIEFGVGDEVQYTFGAPGANLHREQASVFIHAIAPLAASKTTRDLAETYLGQLRNAFRMRRFSVGSNTVRITATAPMGGGEIDGGMWAETLALSYEIYNVG